MSFKACIQTAVETGKLGKKKASEAEAAFDEAFEAGKAEGLSDDAAGDAAGMKALEQVTSLKQEKRWQRLNELRKAHEINERLATSHRQKVF